MAAPISSSSFLMRYIICCSGFLCLILCSLEKGFALEEREHAHTVEVNSLLPATTCSSSSSSTKGHMSEHASSSVLKVIHKHGPCSRLNKHKSKTPTHAQILQQDQTRVNSIHSRVNSKKQTKSVDDLRQSAATTIPAQSGSVVGSGNYIVNVGLGSPKKQLSLIFDTGSDLTWTQCRPCIISCYKQKEPIFDPSFSASYTNVSCTSATCSQLTSATGNTPGCDTSTCIYDIQYGDQSFSIGYFGKEKLSLTNTDVFDGFLFGCGQNNQGLFGGSAGLLGLGRNPISLVEQLAQKYNRFFSYCLPSTSSSIGYLSFGKSDGSSNAVKFTTLSTVSQGDSFYGINVVGINVGETKLPISASVFSSSGTIIDSGTVITRLPPTAYSALKAAFRQAMKSYPLTEAVSILDTCYDFSSFKTVSYPKISFVFDNGLTQDLDATGILYVVSADQVCLAFAGNEDDSYIGIFGNVQQKRLQVVYDIAGGQIGFAPAACP
ncbi:aspartyl protease family protein At5g10770-like [Prunus avium]|uniref:Aspartyl protease family protein At5g10770-like n=1 Tax=Prunus avium TaxID=42229 RepID=A0A6P5RQM5_PRUAV|nr:aspartyl protease family protein At5g10770-like [Prunus avium]